jgi:hypothetical protein
MTKKVFPQGSSTEIEVSMLMQLNLEPGEIVGYSRIERTCGVRHGTPRFKTITQAWRRKIFREQKLQSEAVGGIGIRFLTDAQALGKGINDHRLMARTGRRVATRVKAIDTQKLRPLEQKHKELLQQHLRAADSAARKIRKQLAIPKAVAGTVVRIAG